MSPPKQSLLDWLNSRAGSSSVVGEFARGLGDYDGWGGDDDPSALLEWIRKSRGQEAWSHAVWIVRQYRKETAPARPHRRAGRAEPYTDVGIRRLACVRCGSPPLFQWSACADGNLWRPMCAECDVAVNAIVLYFLNDPDWEEKTRRYAKEKGVEFEVPVMIELAALNK